MTFFTRLMFALRFACTDLFARWKAVWITFVNLGSIFALVTFAVVVYGLVQGTDARQIQQFDADPLAGCLVFRPVSPLKVLTQADVDTLAAAVRTRLAPDRLRAASGFYRLERDVQVPGQPGALLRYRGRTIAPNEPLLASFRADEHWLARRPSEEGQAGVVIDAAMKERLKVSLSPLPDQLQFGTAGAGPLGVDLVGVLKHDLPGRYDFVVPVAVHEKLLEQDRVVTMPNVRSGPLPVAWREVEPDSLKSVKDYLKKNKLAWQSRREHKDGPAWTFAYKGAQAAPEFKEWEAHLNAVATHLEAKHGQLDAEQRRRFARPHALGEEVEETFDTFFRLTLYVRHPDDLDAALETALEQGYEVEDDRHKQLRSLRRMTGQALLAGDVILGALALLALWNVFAIQYLQAKQKLAEVGMLKAMGVTRGRLLAVYLVEALLLWMPGLLLGLWAGWEIGTWAEGWMSRDDPESALAFAIPTHRLVLIVVGSLLVCVVSTLLAMRKALWGSPLECLAEG